MKQTNVIELHLYDFDMIDNEVNITCFKQRIPLRLISLTQSQSIASCSQVTSYRSYDIPYINQVGSLIPCIHQFNIGKNLFVNAFQFAELDGFIHNVTMSFVDAITKWVKFHGNYHGKTKNVGKYCLVQVFLFIRILLNKIQRPDLV